MIESLQPLIDWISAHPNVALAVLFLTSALDTVFIVGALVPAAVVLFAVGAMVALGDISLWSALLFAAAGAVIGDAFSFWLGYHYKERLFEWGVFRRYPEMVSNSRRFFERHGGKSIVLARFLGPMRAITPAVAGASGMKPWIFLLADGFAALPWAALYIGPGVVFGASLGLASEVAGRLAVLMLVLLAVLTVGVWLTQLVARSLQKRAERWIGAMLDWSRRHRILGKFGAALADPEHPETPVLLGVGLLILTLSAILLAASWGMDGQPSVLDMGVYQGLESLRTPAATGLAVFLSQLGSPAVYLAFALALSFTLLLGRDRRAAMHGLAALLFGLVASTMLEVWPRFASPQAYFNLPGLNDCTDLVLVTTLYGYAAAVICTGRSAFVRNLGYAVVTVFLLMITSAQLYLGRIWFSTAAVSLLAGVLWSGALGLGYRRHRRGAPRHINVYFPTLALMLIAFALHVHDEFPERLQQAERAQPTAPLSASGWWNERWVDLPSRRQDIARRDRQLLNLQWAGPLPQIKQTLEQAGWQRPAALTMGNALHWLTSESAIADLPVLPRLHDGHFAALTLRLPLDDRQQYLLRLWPSGHTLDGQQPLWIGSVVVQDARVVARIFRYPINTSIYTPALQKLPLSLPGFEEKWVKRPGASFGILLLRPAQNPVSTPPDPAG